MKKYLLKIGFLKKRTKHGSTCKRRYSNYTFPLFRFSGSKKRPALIVANPFGDDLIMCQITTKRGDADSIALIDSELSAGALQIKSNIRPNKLFTEDSSIILYKLGSLKKIKIKEIENKLIEILIR